MAGSPDDRPVQPDLLQHRLLVCSLINMDRAIFDESKHLHRRRSNRQDTPYNSSIKAPSPRRDYHKGPSYVWLFERMRDEHSRGLLLESRCASDMVWMSVSQKDQLH